MRVNYNYNSYTDDQLASLYNKQDRSAFEEIYNRYWELLYIHAKKMLRDEDQAQDVVQELFISLLTRMGKLKLKPTFNSYLYQTIRFIILDLIRHNQVKVNYIAQIQTHYKEADSHTDNLVLENDLKRIIELEIDKLPPKMKTIFEMSRKAYLSNSEIADATNTTESNVRKQIQQAITKLRSNLTCFICLQIMTTLLWWNRTL
jgi:RNA polymerase sigma-70 factor (ECF subfamily)